MNGVQMCDPLEVVGIDFYVKILLTQISLSLRIKYPIHFSKQANYVELSLKHIPKV